MRYMLTRGKIVSNINNAVPRFLCVKKVDKFLKFFLFIKGMPAAKNKPNALKLNIWGSVNRFLSIDSFIIMLAIAKNIPPITRLDIAVLSIDFKFFSHLTDANIEEIKINTIPIYLSKVMFSFK